MENNSNQSEEQQSNTKSTKKMITKGKPSKTFIKFFIIFILIGGLGAGSYYGYRLINGMRNDISDLKSNTSANSTLISTLDEFTRANDAKINTLSSQVSSGYTNYSPESPVFANLTVEKILEDKNTALEDGFRFIILDLKLENKTQNEIYFNTGELKLKDADNYEYSFYGQYGPGATDYVKKDAKVLLPDNRLPLTYSNIKPGEITKGSAVFVVNRPGSKFTLIRNGEVLRQINL